MKTKDDIKCGDVDVSLKNLKESEVKVRITTFLDKDVLLALKDKSAELGIKYQTFLNQHLRETILGEQGFYTRLTKLEQAVFKKAT